VASNLLKAMALGLETMTSNRSEKPRVDGIRQQLAAVREDYAVAARQGRAGRDVQARYSAQIDALVRQLAEDAREHSGAPLAICALGGYGRRSLCLQSDVDLLILFEDAIGPAEERFINAILQPLWDLKLSVGHHVRELSEFDEPDTGNAEFLLSLLDVRFVAGDQRPFQRLSAWTGEAMSDGNGGSGRRILDALLHLVDERYAPFNGTLYQLEPDIKSAPGGLRDIAAARHIRQLQPSAFSGDAGDMDRSPRLLQDAEDFLQRIRSVLHLETGRDVNILSHDLQEKVAEAFGTEGRHLQQQVEATMGQYFRHARASARALERARRAVTPASTLGSSRHVGRHFEIAPDGVRFLDLTRAVARPGLWLELFRIALSNGCAVSEQALNCIEQNVDRFTADDFLATESDRQLVTTMLYPRPGLYARLSEMHDCGLLNRLFPEFGKVHCRVIRDFHHKYTVDEHTLLAIRGVESLWNAPTASHQRFGSILQEVHAPELLTIALLFHDVGKWRDAEHVQESVRLAQTALDRLELPAQSRQTVEFLIRNHLQMSRLAFRRDLDDPHVIKQFADLIGSEERLKMLTLLTLADVGAVSAETLTPWKEELLWRLYVHAYNRLTLGYADDLLQKDPAGLAVVVAGRPDDITEEELSQFLKGLPRRYLTLFGLGSIYRHVRLARGIHQDEVHAVLERHDDVWELSLVTLDKPYLFSNISGVLAYFGMDIHRGQAMTTPEGLVLDVFQFSDDEGFLRHNPGATSEITGMLEKAVAGSVDVPTLLRGKERSVLYRPRRHGAPVVRFDTEHSRKYTVIELVADDAPGLLHRVSRVISGRGCDVDLVLIATEGKKAIDVLHITKQGKKLTESEQVSLREALERMLEDTHEAR
jgi:[protein-PII] uridylyltransferase